MRDSALMYIKERHMNWCSAVSIPLFDHRQHIFTIGGGHKTLHAHTNNLFEHTSTALVIKLAEHIIEQHYWSLITAFV